MAQAVWAQDFLVIQFACRVPGELHYNRGCVSPHCLAIVHGSSDGDTSQQMRDMCGRLVF